jgi:hypothetical protein
LIDLEVMMPREEMRRGSLREMELWSVTKARVDGLLDLVKWWVVNLQIGAP